MSSSGHDAETQASERRPLRPEPLIAALVDHEVDFIVVGGYAVAAHGFPRATKDIDICPAPREENLAKLARALDFLEASPIGLDEFKGEFDLEPDLDGLTMGGNWTLQTRYGRLDVLQTFSFEDGDNGEGVHGDLAPHTVERDFLGHGVKFCSYDDLLRMKKAAGRAQDMVDVESLRVARGDL
jgi:hypothetical protein